MGKTYYEKFGIQENASIGEIKSAYRRLAFCYHPDRNGGNKKYENTVTVFQHNETTPDGAFNPNNYQQRNYGVEVYAKGIGLIYKDFLHWTYQVTPPPAKYEDASFGVKLTAMSF